MEKKGNRENYNDSTTEESAAVTANGDLGENGNSNAANNASIDTTFIISHVNDHAAIQHQSSDQHSEL